MYIIAYIEFINNYSGDEKADKFLITFSSPLNIIKYRKIISN